MAGSALADTTAVATNASGACTAAKAGPVPAIMVKAARIAVTGIAVKGVALICVASFGPRFFGAWDAVFIRQTIPLPPKMGLEFSNSMRVSAKMGASSRFTMRNRHAKMTAVIGNVGNLGVAQIPPGPQTGGWHSRQHLKCKSNSVASRRGRGFQVFVRFAD